MALGLVAGAVALADDELDPWDAELDALLEEVEDDVD